MALEFLSNIYFWIVLTLAFAVIIGLLLVLLILLAKRTHAIVEFKGWLSGKPIALFFQETGYVEWEPVKSEGGVIEHPKMGMFLVNEKSTYIDRRTKNIIIPFDAAIATGVNIHAAKIADDLAQVVQNKEQLDIIRAKLALGDKVEIPSIDVLKTSVHIGALRSFSNTITPHLVTAKIEKTIQQKMMQFGQPNGMQFLLIFGGALLAIAVAWFIMKQVGS